MQGLVAQRLAAGTALVRAGRCAHSLVRPLPAPTPARAASLLCRDAHRNGAVVEHPHLSSGFTYPASPRFVYGTPTFDEMDGPSPSEPRPAHRDDDAAEAHAAAPSGTPDTPPSAPLPGFKYKRVLLKISGEALQGKQGFGCDPAVLNLVAQEVAEAHAAGLELAVVVGGGNYFRGASAPKGMDRAQADYVGMLATVMNALLLQGALESIGVDTRVMTAIEMREVAEPYIRRRAIRHLQERRVVIFGAGTGNPFFTTDTAAALRAAEMNADVFMKATKVDGVYDRDPMKHVGAKKFEKLSYRQVSIDNLKVMDETAITLCKENDIPVLVFNVMERGNVVRAARGVNVGTVVDKTAD